jgi:hypothetical protein
MLFAQNYYITENIFGQQHIRVVITDTISELIQETPDYTIDCITLNTIKEDLNTDEGKYAVNELSISINQSAVNNEANENCLWFCLGAADIHKNRYIAVYFNPNYDTEETLLATKLFIGKIHSKISGDDKAWYCDLFDNDINPIREYKFTAHTFDLSILSKITLTKKIEKPDKSGYIDPLFTYEYLEPYIDCSLEDTKLIFHPRLMYANAYPVDPNLDYQYTYTRPIAKLYDVIQLLFDLAKPIITELEGTELTIQLTDSDIGISTAPIHYDPYTNYTNTDKYIGEIPYETQEDGSIYPSSIMADRRIQLKIAEDDYGEDWSNIYIYRKMLYPEIELSTKQVWQTSNAKSEINFSLQSVDNLSNLIYTIAKALNCFIVVEFVNINNITIQFISRNTIAESDLIYIIGANNAAIDISFASSKNEKYYYALVSNKTADETDVLTTDFYYHPDCVKEFNGGEPTTIYNNASEYRKSLKDGKNTDSERILFSTANAYELIRHGTPNHQLYSLVPYNSWRSNSTSTPDTPEYWRLESFSSVNPDHAVSIERLSTAIIIRDIPYVAEQVSELGAERSIFLPASKIYVKIDDNEYEYNSLADYINNVMIYDRQFYETEYTITIPFWSGFSSDGTYNNCSIHNLKLGNKIQFEFNIKTYDPETETFSNSTQTTTYVVTSIERSLEKPETKIGLRNVSQYAFTNTEEIGSSEVPKIDILEQYPTPDKQVEHYTVGNTTITTYDAVMLDQNGTIIKAEASTLANGRTIGIALDDGTEGDVIPVQIAGCIYNDDWNWSGEYIYVRTSTGSNLSVTILDTPNTDEDIMIQFGKVANPKMIMIDIKELIYEDGFIQP